MEVILLKWTHTDRVHWERRWTLPRKSQNSSQSRARAHGINANQVFGWRRLYLAGRLGGVSRAIKLLPVHVSESSPSLATTTSRECSPSADFSKPTPGTIHIELRHAQVRIEGRADAGLLRVLLECLQR